MKQGYRREPPSKDEHHPADILGAAVDDEKDEERQPQKAGDFDRYPNDETPKAAARAGRARRANKSARRVGLSRIVSTP
jgi:hypothetical protein